MKYFYIISLLIFLLGCHNNHPKQQPEPFNNFVFSYSTEHLNYSMKFSAADDSVFLCIHFPEKGNTYYSVISKKDKNVLDVSLNTYKLSSFDTTYIQENLQDGNSYKFYIEKDSIKSWVYIYGYEGPEKLYRFSDWLISLKDRLKFYPYNGHVEFGDLRYIQLPIVPAPPIKN